MTQNLATSILKLFGWTLDRRVPKEDKVVIIGYPHTSNWDFPLAMLARWGLDLNFNWVGKHSMFFWPLAGLFKKWGGVPLNREKSEGFIDQVVEEFATRDHFLLTIAPEGTRSFRPRWKTGFYHIAVAAGVPISLGYIDYKTKTLGIGHTFYPSGDIDKDFELIADFYRGKVGKRPELAGTITHNDPKS